MGVQGLTTFISNKSQQCMERFELHDTKVVIDGDAILTRLYLSHPHANPTNECFGGDYDKYGNTIYKFFSTLLKCKIEPYVILDGGYESRKMKKLYTRFKERIRVANNLDAIKRSNYVPLFITEAFEEIVLKLGVKLIRCDFEGDKETANIAKALKCPAMSNDSDFYIFDVPYIPFPSVQMTIKRRSVVNQDTREVTTYKYIPCKIYRVDKFLRCVGMSKDNLPVFAGLVGNDYEFINGRKISKLGFASPLQNSNNRIESIITWLQKETKDSAIEKMLNIFKSEERDSVLKTIEDAISGYSFKDSKYLKYLLDDSFDSDDEDDEDNSYQKMVRSFPKPFLQNFRKSLYPTRFMDIVTQNKYYNFRPQIEVIDYDQAHDVSVEIVAAIHKILTGSSENLVCFIRSKREAVERTLPLCTLDLPSFTDVQTMGLASRKNLILTILNIDKSFLTKSLVHFPESWHLLILTLKTMMNKFTIERPVTYAIILCKLVIDFIDPKVGFIRSTNVFNKRFYSKVEQFLSRRKSSYRNTKILKTAIDSISFYDALIAMSCLIGFFDYNINLKKDVRLFDRKLMHSLSQFQSCLLHVKGLNQLLNKPFHDFLITECFNGTFVYNMTYNLRKREDLDNYVRNLLQQAPRVLNSFEIIVKLLRI